MNRSERRRRLTTILSVLGGGVGGAAGQALGGIVGAAIGGAAGVAVPWCLEALPSVAIQAPVVGRMIRKAAVVAQVKRKLKLEFDASSPGDKEAARGLLEDEAKVIASTDAFGVTSSLEGALPRENPERVAAPNGKGNELLRKGRKIRIACPAICVSAVSVLQLLRQRLRSEGIELELDCSPANSGEIARRFPEEQWDFCVISRLAVVATSGDIDELLFPVLPLFQVSQYHVCRPGLRRTGQSRRVLIVRDSPSEAQFWVESPGDAESTYDYITQEGIQEIAATLREDEFVIMWEPVAGWMEDEFGLEVRRETEFTFLISLMVNKAWTADGGGEEVQTFAGMLREQWDYGNDHRREMLKGLASDGAYLDDFASAMGMDQISS